MKRVFLMLILVSSSNLAMSQKIKSEYDKFEKSMRVTTGWIQLRPTMAAPLAMKLRSVGTSYFITFAGSNVGSSTIGPEDKAYFLLDRDVKLEVTSTGLQSYEIGEHSKSFQHQYSITRDQLDTLAKHRILSIRKYGTSTYADFDISEKNCDNHQKTIINFLEAGDIKQK